MKIKVQLTVQENIDYFNMNKDDIIEIEFEDYIAAVTASEIGNSHIEACKAQAVAARSFAISRGVLRGLSISDSSSNAQAYRAKRYNNLVYPNCILAAKETQGQVLVYQNKVINSIYTASNGGQTVSSQERWGNYLPFLIAQKDPWDAAVGKPLNGTGVGMSQRGCIYAANEGIDYKTILNFYYPGTYIEENYGVTKGDQVVSIAKSFLGYPYVFGAVGEDCTPKNRERRRNASYPSIVDNCQVLRSKHKCPSCNGCKYENTKIFDCRGFTYYCLKQVDIIISTVGATTQWQSGAWVKKGRIIEGLPNCVCCVFKQKGNKMSHTGLHIGDGLIIHCSGEVKYGSIDDTTWTHWAIPLGLYSDEFLSQVKEVKAMATLKRGSSGENVYKLQLMLNTLGYDCGKPDGIFGAKTETAVRSFQKANNLTVDGKVGAATLPVIEAQYDKTLGPETPTNNSNIIDFAKEIAQLKDTLTYLKGLMGSIQAQIEACEEELENLKVK